VGDELQPRNRHAARRELELLLLAGEIVGARAIDLQRRERGGTWMISPVKWGRAAAISARVGRVSLVATTRTLGIVGIGLGARSGP